MFFSFLTVQVLATYDRGRNAGRFGVFTLLRWQIVDEMMNRFSCFFENFYTCQVLATSDQGRKWLISCFLTFSHCSGTGNIFKADRILISGGRYLT